MKYYLPKCFIYEDGYSCNDENEVMIRLKKPKTPQLQAILNYGSNDGVHEIQFGRVVLEMVLKAFSLRGIGIHTPY
jgi:hypothetical protein